MRHQDEWAEMLREIRRRKLRRIFDPLMASLEDDLEDESPLKRYRRRGRIALREQKVERGEEGKPPYAITPHWSLPAASGRGRPVGRDNQRIPHTRNRVGGHSADHGPVAASGNERYITRHEKLADETIEEPTAAIEGDRYINRLEQDAIGVGEPSAVRTNMDPDSDARDDEWLARTRHERKAGKPRINIKSERDPALCRLIADDPRWPEELRIAISADLERHERAGERPNWKAAGEPWVDDDAEAVLDAIREAYGLDPDATAAALVFGRPRAGRVFHKWEAELPRHTNEAERQRYLDDMAADLDATGISFVLVMHRPDPVNHPDNFHVHLLYSDRPVAKIGGGYDIERTVERDYGRGRVRTVHQRQPKLRFVSERAWTQRLREMHVHRCNEALERSGAAWRYHPGGFADIGLDREERQRKLGNTAARYEAAGVATEVGLENALIDWDRVDRRRAAKHARRLARIAAIAAGIAVRTDQASADAISRWRDAAEQTEHARAAAEEAEDAIAMATSRARYAIGKAGPIADTYSPGSYLEHRWRERSREARDAQRAIMAELAPERAALARAREAISTHRAERDALCRAIGKPRSAERSAAPKLRPSATPALSSDPRLAHRFIDGHEPVGVEIVLRGGEPPYPLTMLAAAGLDASAFDDPAVMKRLTALHERQRAEIAAVTKFAARRFVLEGRSDTAHMRERIARWRDHPAVRAAYEQAAAERLPDTTASPQDAVDAPAVAPPSAAAADPRIELLAFPHEGRASQSASAAPAAAKPERLPDGFGGWRDTLPPHFNDPGPHVRVAAFNAATGRPTDKLLMLLVLAAKQPHASEFANDGRLMVTQHTQSMLALLHGWRHDERVAALVVATVRASREAGRPAWPTEIAPAVNAHIARRHSSRTQPSPIPERDIGR